MGITLAVVGVGGFAQSFIPLFKAHPLVREVLLCDVHPERAGQAAREFGIARVLPSLDAVCDSGAQAVALITQPWLHAPQALQALRAGKHVYSAVPTGTTVEEVRDLVRAVQETGLVYMLGETSYYYPAALYCRRRFRAGDFGDVVYAEGEYYHDWEHGLYPINKRRGGDRWLETAGSPPLHYATHSTSLIVSVTGAHATHVSAQGYADRAGDGVYDPAVNRWGNRFSNESALLRMSDGSIARVNEFRRIGHPGTVRMTLFGTAGGFEHNLAGARWVTRDRAQQENLDHRLAVAGERDAGDAAFGVSPEHPVARLPREFAGLPNGHLGSHQFLVHDFVEACVTGRQPPINVWQAARYCLPGLLGHRSATQGGVLLEVPDFGPGPDRPVEASQ